MSWNLSLCTGVTLQPRSTAGRKWDWAGGRASSGACLYVAQLSAGALGGSAVVRSSSSQRGRRLRQFVEDCSSAIRDVANVPLLRSASSSTVSMRSMRSDSSLGKLITSFALISSTRLSEHCRGVNPSLCDWSIMEIIFTMPNSQTHHVNRRTDYLANMKWEIRYIQAMRVWILMNVKHRIARSMTFIYIQLYSQQKATA